MKRVMRCLLKLLCLHLFLGGIFICQAADSEGAGSSDGAISQDSSDSPRLGDEKLIVHTIAGDLVLGLYPEVAPLHVQQIVKLAREGIYDGTHFYRVHRDFVAQTSSAEDRLVPLSSDQKLSIHPLKAEFSSLGHKRGELTMARLDDDVDSAETSFSILLGDAPHLDQKYTIFGRVLVGFDVLDEFLKVPQTRASTPNVRLTILSVEVSTESLETISERRRIADAISIPEIKISEQDPTPLNLAIFGLTAMCIMNAVACAFYWLSDSVRIPLSLTLLSLSTGYFVVVVVGTPIGQREPLVALGIFCGMLLLFKLLSLFDRPDQKKR